MNRWNGVLTGIDPVTGQAVKVGVDSDHNALIVENMVWNPTSLQWERMTQPIVNIDNANLDVTFGDVEALLAGNYFKRSKFYYYVTDNVKYKCLNVDIDALESATTWYIWKFTYDGNDNLVGKEGPRLSIGGVATEGALDALSWNI